LGAQNPAGLLEFETVETAVIFPAPANPRAISKPASAYSNKTHCGAEARQTALTQAHKAEQHALAQQEARRRVAESRRVIAHALLSLDGLQPARGTSLCSSTEVPRTTGDDPGFS
jgi:aspartate/methionine/tyrosine aminotransferase